MTTHLEDLDAPIAPVANQLTYQQAVYESLYDLIQELHLPPGARLVEAELSAKFAISKTPVREALLLLQRHGLVEITAHRGARVTSLSLEDYEQQLFILDALEAPALERVAELATPDELQPCAEIVERLQAARSAREGREYRRLVALLHRELFAIARYPRLTSLISDVQRAGHRYSVLFLHEDDGAWDRELKMIVRRFEHVRRGNGAKAASVAAGAHAEMIRRAHSLVAGADPRVLRFLGGSE